MDLYGPLLYEKKFERIILKTVAKIIKVTNIEKPGAILNLWPIRPIL